MRKSHPNILSFDFINAILVKNKAKISFLVPKVCLVMMKTGRMKNGERKKYSGKWHFLLFSSGEKTRETENKEENNPFGPTFFYPPNLGGKGVK